VVGGRQPATLLDSYESERRPVAQRVTMSTQAQAALISPGSEVTALRVLFAELLDARENALRIAALMAGSDVRYDLGPGPDLVGRWAPDLVLDTGNGPVRLAELTVTARPLLLDFTGTLAAAAEPWRDRVDLVSAKADGAVTAMLLRPDCYVAWASTSDKPEVEGLREALERWFG